MAFCARDESGSHALTLVLGALLALGALQACAGDGTAGTPPPAADLGHSEADVGEADVGEADVPPADLGHSEAVVPSPDLAHSEADAEEHYVPTCALPILPTPDAPLGDGAVLIDAERGGIVTSRDEALTLRVPAGALAEDTEIAIERVELGAGHPLEDSLATYLLRPGDLVLQRPARVTWRSDELIEEYDPDGVVRVATVPRSPTAWLTGAAFVLESAAGEWSLPRGDLENHATLEWDEEGETTALRARIWRLGALLVVPARTRAAVELPGAPWWPMTVELFIRRAGGKTTAPPGLEIQVEPVADGSLVADETEITGAEDPVDPPLRTTFFFDCEEVGPGHYGKLIVEHFARELGEGACVGPAAPSVAGALEQPPEETLLFASTANGRLGFSDGHEIWLAYPTLGFEMECPRPRQQ